MVTVEEGERSGWRVTMSLRFAGFFQTLGTLRVMLEATASQEWFVKLVEAYADRVVIAHPEKLWIIAERTWKTDELDAQALANSLALGTIPESHRSNIHESCLSLHSPNR